MVGASLPLATALWMPLAVVARTGLPVDHGREPVDSPEVLMVTGVAGLAGLALLGYATLRDGLNERRELAAG